MAETKVFLSKCLENLVAKSPRFNKRLPESARGVLEALNSGEGELTPQEILLPFFLACGTEKVKTVVAGLDGIQKLLMMGLLENSHRLAPLTADGVPAMADVSSSEAHDDKEGAEEISRQRFLIDQVVEVVCRCHLGEATDETVELQILKVLLAVITTPNIEVHGHSLLQAVRMCYMIHLTTRDAINEKTARGILDQMVGLVFYNVENPGPRSATSKVTLVSKTGTLLTLPNVSALAMSQQESEDSISSQADDTASSSGQATPSTEASTTKEKKIDTPSAARSLFAAGSTPPGTPELLPTSSRSKSDGMLSPLSRTLETSEAEDAAAPDTGSDTVESDTKSTDDAGAEEQKEASGTSSQAAQVESESSDLATHVSTVESTVEPSSEPSLEATNDAPAAEENAALPSIVATISEEPAAGQEASAPETTIVVTSEPAAVATSPSSESTEAKAETKDGNSLTVSVPTPTNIGSPESSQPPSPSMGVSAMASQDTLAPNAVAGRRGSISNQQSSVISVISASEDQQASMAQRDAYLLFRTLCKLSRRVGEFVVADQERQRIVNIRSKLVALELILVILQNAGPGVQHNVLFVSAIKKHLIISMCSNALVNSTQIYELTLKIFLVLLTRYAAGLKYEIEVCINEIFLKILTSKNSTIEQKTLLLDYLVRICAVPQTLMDIFLNYDCDPVSLESNLFERLVNEMSKLAQIKLTIVNPEVGVSPELYELKMKGLECLAAVLQSLVTWSIGVGDIGKATQESEGAPEEDSVQDNPAQFAQNKQMKQVMLDALKIFNGKPKKGIKYLIEHGVITDTPNDIAIYLLNTVGLDKTAIGEFLGEGDDYNIQIMHSFVDNMHFAQMTFLEALRHFLQAFRLPGEAQKIDRFMLKFAERYVKYNPDIFANADAAYVLAYSCIMLNVDQHNRQIKKRMTKAEFIKNNRGINDNADLPEEFLSAIFDEIHTNEIKMKDDEDKTASKRIANELLSIKDRRVAFLLESKEILKRTQALFSEKKRHAVFVHATRVEHVKPMFENAWVAIFASISGPLQDSEDPIMISLCLRAFTHAAHISCIFYMDLPRDAFMTTLVKYTGLSSPRDIKVSALRQKNFEAVRAVLDVTNMDANYLKSSWNDVLHCFSGLNRLQLLGDSEESPTKSKKRPGASDLDAIAEARSQHMVIAVDSVFANSSKLDADAIVDFVKYLIINSTEEIEHAAGAENLRLYSLQRLVEISHYNMNRIRLEWSRIWSMLGEHFNQVGCSAHFHIVFFAVDSLRQLSMKFLEKGELSYFQFQKDFLAPFLHTITNNPAQEVKELVIRCIIQMIQARSSNIRSGWGVVLRVLAFAPLQTNESLIQSAFDCARSVMTSNLESIIAQNSFSALVSLLVAFAKLPAQPKVSLQAIAMLQELASMLRELPAAQQELSSETPQDAAAASSTVDVRRVSHGRPDHEQQFWIPVHMGFQEIVLRTELEVRTRALECLVEMVRTNGPSQSQAFWDFVLSGVFMSIFNEMSSQEEKLHGPVDPIEWIDTTGVAVVRETVELVTFFFDRVRFALEPLLEALSNLAVQDYQTIAKIACKTLESFVISTCASFTAAEWEKVIATLIHLVDANLPTRLLDAPWVELELKKSAGAETAFSETASVRTASGTPGFLTVPGVRVDDELGEQLERFEIESARQDRLLDDAASRRSICVHDMYDASRSADFTPTAEFQSVLEQCVRQLIALQMLRGILEAEPVLSVISHAHIQQLIQALEKSHSFARDCFTGSAVLRANLFALGLLAQLPDLLKQETQSAHTELRLLRRLLSHERGEFSERREATEAQLIKHCLHILGVFDELNSAMRAREVSAYLSIMCSLLNGVAELDDSTFRKHLKELYYPIVGLFKHPLNPKLRGVLVAIFTRIGAAYGVA